MALDREVQGLFFCLLSFVQADGYVATHYLHDICTNDSQYFLLRGLS